MVGEWERLKIVPLSSGAQLDSGGNSGEMIGDIDSRALSPSHVCLSLSLFAYSPLHQRRKTYLEGGSYWPLVEIKTSSLDQGKVPYLQVVPVSNV